MILTRRDILRYVAAEARTRADEIQELLNLKDIDAVRASLYRARTELGRDERSAREAEKPPSLGVAGVYGHGVYPRSGCDLRSARGKGRDGPGPQ